MVNNSKTDKERGLVFTEKKLKFLCLADIVYELRKSQNNMRQVGILAKGTQFLFLR
jgi:hypothetical protein